MNFLFAVLVHYVSAILTRTTRLLKLGVSPKLRAEPDMHSWLRFYRAEKHLMIADFNDVHRIIVLTRIHASMDIPSRLSELESTLRVETELLHRQLRQQE